MKSCGLLACVVVACSAPPAPPPVPPITPAPPPAPKPDPDDHVDTIHGMTVHDPFRWMETDTARLDRYLDAQARKTRQALDALPGRDKLRDELRAANRGIERAWVAGIAGPIAKPRVFVFKLSPDADQSTLWVRDGWDGKDRLLVDPHARDKDGVHYALGDATPSPDGKHLAYLIAASGSEDSVVEVLDVDKQTVLSEKIDRSQYATISWRDNRSFFHWRRRKPAPTDTRADWFRNSATYLHVLGADPETEVPVFGPSVAPELKLPEESFSNITVTPGSPWAIALASPGTSADLQLFVAKLAAIVPGKPIAWRRISGPDDHIDGYDIHGDTLILRSYQDAPRFKLVSVDAKTGATKDQVGQTDVVIAGYVVAADALYLGERAGGTTSIARIPWNSTRREEVIKSTGTVQLWAYPDRPGVGVVTTSWTEPRREFYYDGKGGKREIPLAGKSPIDTSHLVTEAVEVTSADGTKVAMTILHRADLARDGSAAALLAGYQAYGSLDEPVFWPIILPWANRAVYAVCHGRGSGDRGKQWHLDGSKHNKENGVDDFLACADYLVAQHYTSPAHLTVTGTSAGGMLAGGAVTKRPELFAAAILRVPMVNITRFETTEGGPANVPEIGSLADPEDFKHLLASDPYHRLKPGVHYPPMLITTGRHDVRVPSWIPAKFAARAQSLGGPVLLRVEAEAGHGIGSTRTQVEDEWADLFAFALAQSHVAVR